MRYAFAAGTVLAAFLVGCSGGSSGPGTPPGPSRGGSSSSAPTTAPSAAPSAPASATSATTHFAVNGSSVTGSGSTAAGASDRFAAGAGQAYDITIQSGAKLIAYCDNATSATSASTCSSPANQLISFGAGSLTNDGTLESYPALSEPAGGVAYAQTDSVVGITNTSTIPTVVRNYGTIGDNSGTCCFYGPVGYYGQGDAAALLVAGPATVTNETSGLLTGYNAFFTTSGAGTLDNYGTIFGVNDGALTGYVVTNHAGAALDTGAAGFASIHAYNDVINDGYILGADYAVLANDSNHTIQTFGGPLVPNVKNFDGGAVYDGEISAIPRGAAGPNGVPTTIGTPVLAGAAIEIDSKNVTVVLHDQIAGGVTYLPLVLGPIEGGFNGSYSNPNGSVTGGVLDFEFPDLPASAATPFKAALVASKHTNAKGSFFTGSYALSYGGATYPYEWTNVPVVEFDGSPL